MWWDLRVSDLGAVHRAGTRSPRRFAAGVPLVVVVGVGAGYPARGVGITIQAAEFPNAYKMPYPIY